MNARPQKAKASSRLPFGSLPFANAPWAVKLLTIFILSAFIQLVVGWSLLFRAGVPLLDFDEREYWNLGGQILAGLPMDVGRRTIGYPLILAGLRSVADNLWFVQNCVAILAAAAPPLLAMVVRKLSRSQIAGFLAGVAFALWPVQIFYGASLYSETLALPAFLLFLWLLPISAPEGRQPAGWQWILAGAVLGLTAHIRPMYQLFLPVLMLVLWIDARSLRRAIIPLALVTAGFAAVVLPWSVHVSRQLGQPVLLSANGGETLGGGFNAKLIANGERPLKLPKRSTWDGPGKWIPMNETGYLSSSDLSLPYMAQDKILRERAIRWISENPSDAMYLALRKLTYMWGVYPFAANGWRQALFGNLPTLLLAALFFLAIVDLRTVRRRCARLYLLPLFVSGIALISWGSWRFRLPADAGMIGVVAMLFAARTRSAFHEDASDVRGMPCTTP